MPKIYYSKNWVTIKFENGSMTRIKRTDIFCFEQFYDEELEVEVLRIEFGGGIIDVLNVEKVECLRMDRLL